MAVTALMLICMAGVTGVYAYDSWQSDWNTFTWNAEKGVIEGRVRYFQTWGGAGDGHCGFTDWRCTITVGGYSMQIRTDAGSGAFYERNRDANIVITNSEERTGGDEWEKWVNFEVKIPQSQLNSTVSASIRGVWWRRSGLASDENVNATYQVTCNADRPTLSFGDVRYTERNSEPVIELDWKRSRQGGTDNIYSLGNIWLHDATGTKLGNGAAGNVYSFSGDKASGTFVLMAGTNNKSAYVDLDREMQFQIKQPYTPTSNTGISYTEIGASTTNAKVPAYPQVESFTAEFNRNTRSVDLNWNFNINSANGIEDEFRINYEIENVGTHAVKKGSMNVKVELGVNAYSASLELDEGIEAICSFEIYRTHTDPDDAKPTAWRKLYAKKIETAQISTKHMKATNLKAALAEDKQSIEVTWDIMGEVMSDGTKFTLSRLNHTYGSSEDIALSTADFKSGMYVDEMVKLCNEYQYKMQITPGGNFDVLTAVYTDPKENILPMEQGDILEFTASKGYFSDRVELSWTKEGPFDEFAVERKEYGQDDVMFKKILTEPSSETSNDYTVKDETSEPGKVYVYRVTGLANCSDTVLESASVLTDVGFRTPTGDIYGRVTYENGQAEDSVEVYLESDLESMGKSLYFSGETSRAEADGTFLNTMGDSVTIQAWVRMDGDGGIGRRSVIGKKDMYEVGLTEDNKVYFKVGDGANEVVSDEAIASGRGFFHVTAVKQKDRLYLYIDGDLSAERAYNAGTIETGESNALVFGGSAFKGWIDEVRVWSRALSANEIGNDYNRYIVGNETGLAAYYTFNYSVENAFYDVSYDKMSVYNENHGTMTNVKTDSEMLPTNEQLGYRAYTGRDGTYKINGIPYIGNGTSYNIIPKRGIHEFEPQQEIRLISAGSQNFTVNFTDVSSFDLPITVVYEGGTYPVQGVQFQIDGVVALNEKNAPYQTDAAGEVTIRVPVGTHEVKAVMTGHTFAIDGRICDSDSADLNYQDNMERRTIEDITLVKYIGRVAGGTVQEAYPLGFGLSKNNLADNMTVTLSHQRAGYEMYSEERSLTYEHELAGREIEGADERLLKMESSAGRENSVIYNAGGAVISVNNETGEFVAWLRPEKYTLTVHATGHVDIPGNNSELNLTSAFKAYYEKYEHTDSVWMEQTDSIMTSTPIVEDGDTVGYDRDTTLITDGDSVFITMVDSVMYNMSQKFISRVKPEVSIVQMDRGQQVPYYGNEVIEQTDMLGDKDSIVCVNGDGTYVFGRPVFVMDEPYVFDVNVYEGYRYNGKDDKVDKVPTQDATIRFNNQLSYVQDTTLSADSLGHLQYTFYVGAPNINTGIQQVSANVTIGSESGSSTSFAWILPDNFSNGEAYVIGGRHTGTNFVTGGPDRLLTVLRDPPGSNSYAYLEKGVTFNETTTYSGTFTNEGKETVGAGAKNTTSTLAGSPMGGTVTSTTETDSESAAGVVHSESYTGANGKMTSTTTTSRFATSSSPEYVGADGDLYVGYATNMTFGQTNNVAIISREVYENAGGADYYEAVFEETDDWIIVQKDGTNISQTFKTLFAYPQRHIIDVLIPNLEKVRNQYLMSYESNKNRIEELRQIAIDKDTVFYLSYFDAGHADYGKSNSDTTITDRSHGSMSDVTDGPSYMIIYNDSMVAGMKGKDVMVPIPDTINFINQSIEAWEQRIADNERQKTEAELMQNYSFHAGGEVEYSESYSGGRSHTSSFEILLGMIATANSGNTIFGIKAVCDFEEIISTTQGGEWSSEVERSHCKGFVLAEDGTDYITVDVMREKGSDDGYDIGGAEGGMVDTSTVDELDYYPAFIFRTKGGATSCPYEGERVTQYYNPGTQLDAPTMVVERPAITADIYTLDNVPSGEPARFTVYMSNESEVDESVWFNLKVIDASNPDGARIFMDGSAIGSGRRLIVPSGDVLTKTIEIEKGAALDYDNLQLVLESECQGSDDTDSYDDIADTLSLSVHFLKSCTDVMIEQPADGWTYNTKLDTATMDNLSQHYMNVVLSDFDVNYADFDHIELQYKPASGSENDYITLANFYANDSLYSVAVANGMTAEMISSSDGGKINYRWFMDNLQDQRYDLRAVAVCNIDNELTYNYSPVSSGIKDMYNPRLFGSAQPADGILGIEDEIRLNFNETIAEGYLTKNNFQVTGVRNGTETDHSVSVQFDGIDDYLASDVVRNLTAKDFTVEMWINGNAQDAVLFSHGNVNDNINFGITADNHLFVEMNGKETRSNKAFTFDQGSWAHVAMTYTADGRVSLYYNYDEILSEELVGAYQGIGNIVVGKGFDGLRPYAGKLHNMRVWDKIRTMGELQLNSNVTMSGNDVGLMLYCPMDEGRGTVIEDKARAAHLAMYGCEWAMPEGRSTMFDGTSGYLTANTSAAVIQSDMDFTIEFWFKAEEGSKSAAMLSNGLGDGNDLGGSLNTFTIGFDENGHLYFVNNSNKVIIDGDYADNSWHHIAVTAGRVQGRVQIYMDGRLTTYFGVDKVGGIEGASLYIGARGWYSPGDAATLHVGEHFKGSIDEVRLWKLYKTAALVEEYMYKRLDGDEIGLIAYYPFEYYKEWQGALELDYTLQDQVVPGDGQTAPTAVVTGTAVENADIAPIVDKGPVSDLEYNYVVNNDALIITLDEPYESVEKTIVTFTAEGILDQNGNEILSPITWSAYIDRNQLKWSQNEWTDTKQLYEEYEFTVDIINNGGSIINYTIENMPSWLSAEPSEGKMDPSSTQHVTFTVREDLNVGTYNEVIYLTNEDNVSEPLELNLTVAGDIPEWSVDPSAYKYSMSVFGKMRFNNIFSDDENDIIAAFSGSECVGVANSVYNSDVDMWYAMLTVYGNVVSGTALTFRMWDASTGITYEATPSEEITFSNNAIYGTPAEPVIFDGQTVIYQDIALGAGWNWISFNLENDRMSDLDAALSSGSWRSGDQIKVMMLEDGNIKAHFADYSAVSNGWKNADFGLNNVNMFMLYTSNEQTLSVDGVLADPTEHPLTLKAGMWNYIGFLPNMNLPVKTALAGYEAKDGDVVKSIDKFAMYSGNNWIGSLEYMEPTAGYMLLNNDQTDKTLVYPTTLTTVSQMPAVLPSGSYSLNMSVIAVGELIAEGDMLYAEVDDEERGVAVPVHATRDGALQFISVAGDEAGETVTFRLVKADGSEYTSVNRLPYKANAVVGTPDEPYLLHFVKAEEDEDGQMTLSPNPADDFVTVSVTLAEAVPVTISIFDVSGRVLYTSDKEATDAGVYSLDVNVSTFPEGSYLVEVHAGNEVYVGKLIKK